MKTENMFKKEFDMDGMAYTLDPEHIGVNDSGWTIEGEIHEDEFFWVNEFKATHPIYGCVCGNFEKTVYATSEEAYNHFFINHEPQLWEYENI